MPKKFTEKEKSFIKQKLKKEAIECLALYGLKKTTVDELVKRVNIPKGTFYLFYESKELLIFEVIQDLHDAVQKELMIKLDLLTDNLTVDLLTEVLFELFKKVKDSGLLSIMMNGDLDLLMRKLPEDLVNEHHLHDDNTVEQILGYLKLNQKVNTKVYSGAFRGIFLTMLFQREIGEDIYEDSLKLMLRGIIRELFKENEI
ncbi:MAG: TetR family transcriptional regulator [Herbinix sp.]|jgi:AcrR family transcriptional regulator|nr:TetR family transcriptional regulator [Herbinix sp.]